MAVLALQKLVRRLRKSALRSGDGDLTDGRLLAHFIDQRDEAAFAALVQRHGPMVLAVCRRLLGNLHDADDAFQATFLILVHKAGSLRSCELVGNWLYGVACNTALAARARNARRRSKEKHVTQMPEPAVTPPDDWSELRPLLDRELSQLAGVYREAIVLCDLEGKTRKEAARQLGVPEGTMSGRLTTARRQLAQRLARKGLTLSAGAVATMLSQSAASACVPAPLVNATVKAAATVAAGAATAGAFSASVVALTEGVMKTMFASKVKTLTAVVLALFLAAAVVLVGHALASPASTQDQRVGANGLQGDNTAPVAPVVAQDQLDAGKDQEEGNKDLESLKGTWNIDTMAWSGKSLPKELMNGYKFVFAGNKLTWEAAIGIQSRAGKVMAIDHGTIPCDFKIDPGKEPKQIDITLHLKKGDQTVDRTVLGIYEIKGDALKVCYDSSQTGKRPTDFSTSDAPNIAYITLTRAKKKTAPERSVYHADPEHLWNRLHAALFVRVGPDGRAYGHDRLEPLLWPTSGHLLEEQSHKRAVAVLEEFLKDKGEKLALDPLQWAVLQRDLWLVFNWLEGAHGSFAEPALTPEVARAARERLRRPLAAVIGRLALTPDQIKKLPDNYAAAVVSGKFAKQFDSEQPDQPFLPSELFVADGPWVCVGRPDGPMAPEHMSDDGGNNVFTNSAFFVFLRLPAGSAATVDYLKRLRSFDQPLLVEAKEAENRSRQYLPNPQLPQFPAGTQVALVRRALLIAAPHTLTVSALTESVQLRVYREVPEVTAKTVEAALLGGTAANQRARAWQSFHEFRLSRSLLFAGEAGGLRAVGLDERDFGTGFSSHTYDELEYGASRPPDGSFPERNQHPIRKDCFGCHSLPGVSSFNSFFKFRSSNMERGETRRPFSLSEMPLAEVGGAAVKWKEGRPNWTALRKILAE